MWISVIEMPEVARDRAAEWDDELIQQGAIELMKDRVSECLLIPRGGLRLNLLGFSAWARSGSSTQNADQAFTDSTMCLQVSAVTCKAGLDHRQHDVHLGCVEQVAAVVGLSDSRRIARRWQFRHCTCLPSQRFLLVRPLFM